MTSALCNREWNPGVEPWLTWCCLQAMHGGACVDKQGRVSLAPMSERQLPSETAEKVWRWIQVLDLAPEEVNEFVAWWRQTHPAQT
jgi:hypothetical protein